ncbi:asparagine synthase C-terminal domain-containing protein [Kiloniella majae]|uniref:asparagine synthase C-terminal domain-containing protein n=1 Tax=Kiloniella majae TaxID=1938558 RepID=UPI0015C502A6|nr:asparagine synthase C-terminal domain-containing protein [Kiloniella majae]
MKEALKSIINLSQIANSKKLSDYLKNLSGHFAFILSTEKHTILIVDCVRSIPILFAKFQDTWVISDTGSDFVNTCNLSAKYLNQEQTKIFAMSGFTTGKDTIYKNINCLEAGSFVRLKNEKSADITFDSYYYINFQPWKVNPKYSDKEWLDSSKRVLENLIIRTIKNINNRQVLIPLSAGLDSRLLASGLRHFGYENVVCFSYGLRNNHEANAAREIAKKLNYPWYFIETTRKEFKNCRQKNYYQEYLEYADTFTAVPSEQDVVTISKLRSFDWVDSDAIIINGQSGDFITGGHVSNIFSCCPSKFSKKSPNNILISELVKKHYGLWPTLQNTKSLKLIKSKVIEEIKKHNAPEDSPQLTYALYELSEHYNRQTKYVIQGQRSYDFFGFDWRLPFWDTQMIQFWQSVPLPHKINQSLYKKTLYSLNWGGVWKDCDYPEWISPTWVKPIRLCTKLACSFLGKSIWHKIERRFFSYFMDILCIYSATSWWEIATSPRDHRNSISWLSKKYLKKHNLRFDGSLR